MRGFDVFPVSFLSSLAILIGGTAALLEVQPDLPAALNGSVVEARRLDPISGAQICLETHGRTAARLSSDPRGQFAVGELEPGYYRISITHAGFAPARRGLELPAGKTRTIRAELAPRD
ncbi:MAG: carboxypeptidase-like regulatory domain-containing protein [Planctomycetota bacterium]